MSAFTVLDIETVPNPDVDPKVLKDVQGPPSCHCVVASATMEVGAGPKYKTKLQSHGAEGAEEREIVESTLEALSKDATLVTWGGRWFDVPVLIWACYRLGIQTRRLQEFMGHRYSSGDVHTDMVETTSVYGATPRSKLLHACQIIGLPGKTDTDGSMVADLYDKGELARIRKYNRQDVAQTGIVYARWLYMQGQFGSDAYNAIVANIIQVAHDVGVDVEGWDRLVIK